MELLALESLPQSGAAGILGLIIMHLIHKRKNGHNGNGMHPQVVKKALEEFEIFKKLMYEKLKEIYTQQEQLKITLAVIKDRLERKE